MSACSGRCLASKPGHDLRMDAAAWTLPPLAGAGLPVAASIAASTSGSRPVLAWASAGLPVVMPLAGLPAAMQADFAAVGAGLPLDYRVAALLAVDRRGEAFALASASPRPLGMQGRLELELAAWAGREQLRLGLPAGRGPVLVVGDDGRGTLSGEVRGALEDVREVLAPLPWPRWAGAVVVYVGGDERGIPPDGVARPALPLIRLPGADNARPTAAAILARLTLRLCVPPSAGWPAWLTAGVAEVCRARAAGEGPSPRAMRERRQAAGAAAIRTQLTVVEADPALCGALIQPLLAPGQRDRFTSFLDLLRQGASSEGALRVAYGVTPESW